MTFPATSSSEINSLPDLASCETEAIETPGSIQPHGGLIAVDATSGRIVFASQNAPEMFTANTAVLIGESVETAIASELWEIVKTALSDSELTPVARLLGRAAVESRLIDIVAHRADLLVIIEAEPVTANMYDYSSATAMEHALTRFVTNLQSTATLQEISELAAKEVRTITGFDRVLVYSFEDDEAGTVIAEDGNGRLPSLRNHRFPASDIPRQARELYRINRIRCIPDAAYVPNSILRAASWSGSRDLDLSHATLRSVSPVHVEYLLNMRTLASMSMSILVDGALWGLISCHNTTARFIPFGVRSICDLLTNVYSLQVAVRQRAVEVERKVELKSALTQILATILRADDFVHGIRAAKTDLLELVKADGFAVVSNARCEMFGNTPAEPEVRELAGWLDRKQDVFYTDTLSSVFPPARQYSEVASGICAVTVSALDPTTLVWFRPELLKTIQWGGNPSTAKNFDPESGRIHPRKSFETWSETIRSHSSRWNQSEIEAIGELRNALVLTILRKAEELAALSAELRRSNTELEAFSYSVSHDLRAPLRHIVGYSELLKSAVLDRLSPDEMKHLDTIIESTEYAGKLIDNLLSFSRIGRSTLEKNAVDLGKMVEEVRRDLLSEYGGRNVTWKVASLPVVTADPILLKLAVANLLSNAVKYSAKSPTPMIEVGCEAASGEITVFVKDNGVGFDMKYVDKLFGVFQRLHRWEDFEGTGIGLANVRRIVDRHGGRTWAVGKVSEGATFYFTIPADPP